MMEFQNLKPWLEMLYVTLSLYVHHCSSFNHLISTDEPTGQGVTVVPKDKTPHTLIEYSMDHLHTPPCFIPVIFKQLLNSHT